MEPGNVPVGVGDGEQVVMAGDVAGKVASDVASDEAGGVVSEVASGVTDGTADNTADRATANQIDEDITPKRPRRVRTASKKNLVASLELPGEHSNSVVRLLFAKLSFNFNFNLDGS